MGKTLGPGPHDAAAAGTMLAEGRPILATKDGEIALGATPGWTLNWDPHDKTITIVLDMPENLPPIFRLTPKECAVIEAAKAHLSATGACDESVDDDSLCESGGCSYCALARKVEALQEVE